MEFDIQTQYLFCSLNLRITSVFEKKCTFLFHDIGLGVLLATAVIFMKLIIACGHFPL